MHDCYVTCVEFDGRVTRTCHQGDGDDDLRYILTKNAFFIRRENDMYGIMLYEKTCMIARERFGDTETLETMRVNVNHMSSELKFGEILTGQDLRMYGPTDDELLPHGRCAVIWDTGRVYVGDFEHGLFHGVGYAIDENGEMTYGMFARGRQQGDAIVLHPDGIISCGTHIACNPVQDCRIHRLGFRTRCIPKKAQVFRLQKAHSQWRTLARIRRAEHQMRSLLLDEEKEKEALAKKRKKNKRRKKSQRGVVATTNEDTDLSQTSPDPNCVDEVITDKVIPEKDSIGDEEDDSSLCVVCITHERSHVVVPCGHMCLCERCVDRVTECPMCRGHAQCIVKVYM